VLRIVVQVAAVAGSLGAVAWLVDNARVNLADAGLDTDFDFLDDPADFQIAFSGFRPGDTVRAALLTGFKNTLIVAAVGIVLTLVLGTIVGIARLSGNWLVRTAAGAYVETLRNIPPLLVIVFANAAVLLPLPTLRQDAGLEGWLVVSNLVIVAPSFVAGPGTAAWLAVLAGALVLAGSLGRWRTRRAAATGAPRLAVVVALGTFVVVAAAGYVALGAPVTLSRPSNDGGAVSGGIAMGIPFAAVLIGLTLYTASHVAEIVRGAIQSVARGQVEAASALALSPGQRLRFVVLPQAFRVAIPPVLNQFLNLTKNSSLGIAVGYAELAAVTSVAIPNGSPAPQAFVVLMGLYLVVSLSVSGLANVANRRLQLVER